MRWLGTHLVGSDAALEPVSLAAVDAVLIAAYFVMVAAVGFWAWLKERRGARAAEANNTASSSDDFFLAGRSMKWPAIGLSLFVSNIGSEHLVGLAGSAAATGVPVGFYEWSAGVHILVLGWLFAPIYLRARISTLPEYLEACSSRLDHWVVPQDSLKRRGWDLLVCLLIFFTFLFVPIQIAFSDTSTLQVTDGPAATATIAASFSTTATSSTSPPPPISPCRRRSLSSSSSTWRSTSCSSSTSPSTSSRRTPRTDARSSRRSGSPSTRPLSRLLWTR